MNTEFVAACGLAIAILAYARAWNLRRKLMNLEDKLAAAENAEAFLLLYKQMSNKQ